MKLRNEKVLDSRVVSVPWGRRRIPIPQKTILRLIDMKLHGRDINVLLIWYYCTTQDVVRGIRSDTQGTVPVDTTRNKLDLILQWLSVGRPFRSSKVLPGAMRHMRAVNLFARLEIKAAMEERSTEFSKEMTGTEVSRVNRIKPKKLQQRNTMLLRSKRRTGTRGLRKKKRKLKMSTEADFNMMSDVCDDSDVTVADAIMLWEILNKQEVIARMRRDPGISDVRAKQSKMMLILQWMKQGKPFSRDQRISSLIDLRRVIRRVEQYVYVSNHPGTGRKKRRRARRNLFRFM